MKLKDNLIYLKKVMTEQEIIKRLDISVYRYKKLLENVISDEESEYFNEKVKNEFSYELGQLEKLDEVSIEERIYELLSVLRDYHSVVQIGKYVDVSDTHLHRILDGKDKVKYTLPRLKKFEDMYYGTDILKEEEIPFYPHTYKEELKVDKSKKYDGIEKDERYVIYELSFTEDIIPRKLRYLREEKGLTGMEIARRLDISNTSFHFALKGKMPKDPVKLLNMIIIEFDNELEDF